MNILYVSTLVSPDCINKLLVNGYEPLQSIQKFNWLLVQGFNANGCKVNTLSNIPVLVKGGDKLICESKEVANGISFNYCPKIKTKGLDNVVVFLYSLFKTIIWIRNNKRKNSVIILDTLKLSISTGSLIAGKIMRVKTVGIVTDIAGIIKETNPTIKQKLSTYFINLIIEYYDSYILLTEQINEVINRKQKPYIIMEGLVDADMSMMTKNIKSDGDNKVRSIMYAGGLYAKYGLRDLIKGFMKLEDPNIELHLYGHGDMIDEIKEYTTKDNRVRYFGVVHNDKIVEAELEATLLVNPRPTKEEFTKYSFPSKNMEYMVSGTPVLTTVLPGMPLEYHNYVYLFKDESDNGIYKSLKHLLIELTDKELNQKSKNAKQFVLEKKNNNYQAKRVLEFIMKNENNN